MKKAEFIITELSEIIVLRKAIVMLKYNHDIADISKFLGSTVLYQLLVRIEEMAKKANVGRAFFLTEKDDIELIKGYIKCYPDWHDFSDSDKAELIKMMAYPLGVGEILLDELLQYGNENNQLSTD